MNKQPTRMLDDPSESAFVRELLQAGTEDRVTDLDYNEGLAKHLAIIAAATLLPVWAKSLVSGSGTSSTVSGLSAKAIAFVVGLPVVTAGVVASIVISNQEPEMRPADTTKSLPTQTSQNPSVTAPQKTAPSREITTSGIEVSNEQIPSHPTAVEESLDPLDRERMTNRTRSSDPTRARTAVRKIRSKEPARKKRVELDVHRPSNATSPPATEKRERKRISTTPVIRRRAVSQLRQERREQTKKPRIDENSFERETRMLAAANRLLEGDPERSLELAKRGEREFPGSMFTEERRHVLILALIKLSRLDEARQIAGPYLRDYPKSPFAQRVRHALAKAQREQ